MNKCEAGQSVRKISSALFLLLIVTRFVAVRWDFEDFVQINAIHIRDHRLITKKAEAIRWQRWPGSKNLKWHAVALLKQGT